MSAERQEKWVRFITPQNIRDKEAEICAVLKTLSQIDFEAVLSLFKPEVRVELKNLYKRG